MLGGLVSWLWSGEIMNYVWAYMLPIAFFFILFGMANVFAGARLFGLVVVLGGAAFGLMLGAWSIPVLRLENTVGSIIVPCLIALFVAWVAGALYKLAVCAAVMIPAYSLLSPLFYRIFSDNELTAVAMSVFAALLCGIFAVILMKYVMLVITAFIGGAMVGCGVSLICLHFDFLTENLIILDSMILACAALFGVLGCVLQFKRKKHGSGGKHDSDGKRGEDEAHEGKRRLFGKHKYA